MVLFLLHQATPNPTTPRRPTINLSTTLSHTRRLPPVVLSMATTRLPRDHLLVSNMVVVTATAHNPRRLEATEHPTGNSRDMVRHRLVDINISNMRLLLGRPLVGMEVVATQGLLKGSIPNIQANPRMVSLKPAVTPTEILHEYKSSQRGFSFELEVSGDMKTEFLGPSYIGQAL